MHLGILLALQESWAAACFSHSNTSGVTQPSCCGLRESPHVPEYEETARFFHDTEVLRSPHQPAACRPHVDASFRVFRWENQRTVPRLELVGNASWSSNSNALSTFRLTT
ncbi:hypothetical protein BDZ45DRAFT_747110 [Acephala macrosclerotiorum]|nr:hypothetical protein BDZ45DRAFT_747110 [Acephala macrosclerotiorum]